MLFIDISSNLSIYQPTSSLNISEISAHRDQNKCLAAPCRLEAIKLSEQKARVFKILHLLTKMSDFIFEFLNTVEPQTSMELISKVSNENSYSCDFGHHNSTLRHRVFSRCISSREIFLNHERAARVIKKSRGMKYMLNTSERKDFLQRKYSLGFSRY